MRTWELFEEFELAARASNRSPRTLDWYTWQVKRFVGFLQSEGIADDCHSFTAGTFRQYIASLQEGYAPQTVANNVKALKALFHFGEADELLPSDPTRRVQVPKVPDIPAESFTADEVATLLRACDTGKLLGARDFAVVLTLFDCALRAAEFIALQTSDVDFRHGLIRTYGKGAKERFVPVSARTLRALKRYMRLRDAAGYGDSGYVFENHAGQPLTRSGLNQLLKRLGKKTGLHVHPHKLRHSFAVVALRNGAREYDIQDVLGHTTLTMTKRYARQNSEDLARAHSRFSPADSLKLRI